MFGAKGQLALLLQQMEIMKRNVAGGSPHSCSSPEAGLGVGVPSISRGKEARRRGARYQVHSSS